MGNDGQFLMGPVLDVAYRKLLPQRGSPDQAFPLHAAVRRSIVPGSVAVVKVNQPTPAALPEKSVFEERKVWVLCSLAGFWLLQTR
jgi:hypothetical protein